MRGGGYINWRRSEKNRNMFQVSTLTSPAQSNHSFNGICFRVLNRTLDTVRLRALTFGGEIGPFTVWTWDEEEHHKGVAPVGEPYKSDKGWRLCAVGHGAPSSAFRVQLEESVDVPPKRLVWMYVHTSLQHDRGILYQSFISPESRVAEDETLTLLPGCARLGATPFAPNGFFRRNRGFSGSIDYDVVPLWWSAGKHLQFPEAFRKAVFAVLLCHNSSDGTLNCMPFEVLLLILEKLYWRDFERREGEESEEEVDGDGGERRGRGCCDKWSGVVARGLGYMRLNLTE